MCAGYRSSANVWTSAQNTAYISAQDRCLYICAGYRSSASVRTSAQKQLRYLRSIGAYTCARDIGPVQVFGHLRRIQT
jgi:hypothetical protein